MKPSVPGAQESTWLRAQGIPNPKHPSNPTVQILKFSLLERWWELHIPSRFAAWVLMSVLSPKAKLLPASTCLISFLQIPHIWGSRVHPLPLPLPIHTPASPGELLTRGWKDMIKTLCLWAGSWNRMNVIDPHLRHDRPELSWEGHYMLGGGGG